MFARRTVALARTGVRNFVRPSRPALGHGHHNPPMFTDFSPVTTGIVIFGGIVGVGVAAPLLAHAHFNAQNS